MKNKSLLTKVLAFFVCFGFFQSLVAQSTLTWQDRGPQNNAGPVRAVLFDQSDATGQTLYAGSLNGGLWKSVNQGLYWEKINLSGANLTVSCMIQASDDKIYVGTGTYFDDQRAAYRVKGTGLYVSTDGDNFSLVQGTNGEGWEYINAIAIDNQGRIYVATPSGLNYLDAGSTEWKIAKGTDEGNAVDLTGVAYDVKTSTAGLVIAFVNGKAYTSSNAGPEQFICQSLKYKDGSAWVAPTKLPKNDVSRMAFAIAPSDENVVYASSANGVGSLEGVYVSRDGGNYWSSILPSTTGAWNIFAGSGTNYGAYYNEIIVAPDDADRIFVGCVDMYTATKVDTSYYYWHGGAISSSDDDPSSAYYIHSFHSDYVFHPANPNLMAIASDGGVTISTNQASTFSTRNKLLNCAHIRAFGVDNYDDILVGTFGSGVQFMDAATGNKADGYEKYDGALSGNGGYQLMSQISDQLFFTTKSASVGTPDYNDFIRSDDRGLSYSASFKSSEMTSGTELMPMALHENYFDMSSVDSVKFVALKPFSEGDLLIGRSKTDRFPFPFTCPKDLDSLESIMLIDPVETRFFIGWNKKLYMSMNLLAFAELPEWWKLDEVDSKITAIAFTRNANYVFFGTEEGKVYRLKNVADAKTAEQASMDSTQCIIVKDLIADYPNSSVTSIAADKSDVDHIIVTLKSDDAAYTGKLVYRSTNATATSPVFASIHGNLPDAQVNAALIEMNGNIALIGSAEGLYYTNNIGSGNWTKEDIMGTVPVTHIYQQTLQHSGIYAVESYDKYGVPASGTYYSPTTNYGVIYVSTYGRGMWSSSDFVGIVDNPISEKVSVTPAVTVNPNPVTNRMVLSLNRKFSGAAQVSVINLQGQKVKEMQVNFAAGVSAEVECNDLLRGTYMVQVRTDNFDAAQKFVVVK